MKEAILEPQVMMFFPCEACDGTGHVEPHKPYTTVSGVLVCKACVGKGGSPRPIPIHEFRELMQEQAK
jgi:hypothetical protein